MAVGDITAFDEGKANMLGWADADVIMCAILDNTTTPTAADATPALADYTEVGAAGSYTAGGTSLGTWANFRSEASGTVTLDSTTNPTWTQNASNDTDASWALVYNTTQAGDPALFFVELGTVDMTAGPLTVTWNASGLASF